MLILGAKGFAKELLEVIHQNNYDKDICFYDDVSKDIPEFLYGKFKVLRTENEIIHHFKTISPRFTIGIGNPKLRKFLFQKLQNIGGGEIH